MLPSTERLGLTEGWMAAIKKKKRKPVRKYRHSYEKDFVYEKVNESLTAGRNLAWCKVYEKD